MLDDKFGDITLKIMIILFIIGVIASLFIEDNSKCEIIGYTGVTYSINAKGNISTVMPTPIYKCEDKK